jgi:Uma2 family endonuclease
VVSRRDISWYADGDECRAVLGNRAPDRESGGIFGAADDWRVPDQVYARPEHGIDEGYVSAELVIEIRSPGDDSYRKLGFYAARAVGEVLILHEDRRGELFRLGDDGVLARVAPAGGGVA